MACGEQIQLVANDKYILDLQEMFVSEKVAYNYYGDSAFSRALSKYNSRSSGNAGSFVFISFSYPINIKVLEVDLKVMNERQASCIITCGGRSYGQQGAYIYDYQKDGMVNDVKIFKSPESKTYVVDTGAHYITHTYKAKGIDRDTVETLLRQANAGRLIDIKTNQIYTQAGELDYAIGQAVFIGVE